MADGIAQGKTAGEFRGLPRGKAVVKGGGATAARVVGLLGGIYSWAKKREFVVGQNPVRRIETLQGQPKERTLNAEELCALGKVLDESAASLRGPVAALRIIALTGLRREEVCRLRWAEIDVPASCLRLERTKTGRSVRPIGSAAIEVLQSIARVSDKWVFPNREWIALFSMRQVDRDILSLRVALQHALERELATNTAFLVATVGVTRTLA